MLFDEEIKNETIYNENQEEDNSFDMKSKEVVTVFTELVRKVKYQISKLKNKNLIRKRQRNEDNWDRKFNYATHIDKVGQERIFTIFTSSSLQPN